MIKWLIKKMTGLMMYMMECMDEALDEYEKRKREGKNT